jgi:hypothetical protein
MGSCGPSQQSDDSCIPLSPASLLRRPLVVVLLVLAVLALGVRAALPPLITKHLNGVVNDVRIAGSVQDVDLHLWRGAFSIHGLENSEQISDATLRLALRSPGFGWNNAPCGCAAEALSLQHHICPAMCPAVRNRSGLWHIVKVVVPRNANPRGESANQRRNYADGAGKELWYDQSCNTDRRRTRIFNSERETTWNSYGSS